MKSFDGNINIRQHAFHSYFIFFINLHIDCVELNVTSWAKLFANDFILCKSENDNKEKVISTKIIEINFLGFCVCAKTTFISGKGLVERIHLKLFCKFSVYFIYAKTYFGNVSSTYLLFCIVNEINTISTLNPN